MKKFLELIRDAGDSCMTGVIVFCVGVVVGLYAFSRLGGTERENKKLQQELVSQKHHYDSLMKHANHVFDSVYGRLEYTYDTLRRSRTTFIYTEDYDTGLDEGYKRGYEEGYNDCADEHELDDYYREEAARDRYWELEQDKLY